MVKTLKKQKIRFEDTLRFANLFIMMRVSFSNGNVIVIHSFHCHPNPQMLQKYPKGSTVLG